MRTRLAFGVCAAALAATACAPSASAPPAPGDPVLREPVPVVIWSSRDLPRGLDARVAAIEGVRWVTRVSVGMVDLVAVGGANKPLPRRASGAVLPLSIAAMDPSPEEDDAAARALAAGEAVLTRTAAALRGMAPGSTITIGAGRVRRSFRVGAIIPDDEGRQREVLIPLAASAGLGLTKPRALITSVAPDRLPDAVRAMHDLTAGVRARIRAEGDEGGDISTGQILAFAEVKKLFGEFTYRPERGTAVTIDQAWVDRNIVKVRVPLLGLIACNARVIPQLTGAMRELQARGLGGLVRTSSGCYSPRMQVGNAYALSRHAYGIAVDINATTNRYGETPAQDARLVDVMERWGFTWGGRWLVPDGMHFEFLRFADRASASAPSRNGGH